MQYNYMYYTDETKAPNGYTDYEKIDIKDDFMFCTVMKNSELCRKFLERVLGISIREIKYLDSQKTFAHSEKAKSIRLDVYANDEEGTVYDIEMQKRGHQSYRQSREELPKRARYYSGMIDMEHLKKGQSYKKLPRNIIIFVCDFDPFAPENKAVYSFEYKCSLGTKETVDTGVKPSGKSETTEQRNADKRELKLEDGTQKVFVNIRGNSEELPEELKSLLTYMASGEVTDEYTADLNSEVHNLRYNEEWRVAHMTFEEKLNETYEDGVEAGITKGKAIGLEEGKSIGLEEGKSIGLEEGLSKGKA